jgi:hypothetical protein
MNIGCKKKRTSSPSYVSINTIILNAVLTNCGLQNSDRKTRDEIRAKKQQITRRVRAEKMEEKKKRDHLKLQTALRTRAAEQTKSERDPSKVGDFRNCVSEIRPNRSELY